MKRNSDGQEYALKKVKLKNLTEKERQNALNEVRILASLHHINMISYKEAFIDDNSGSLWYIYIHIRRSVILPVALSWSMLIMGIYTTRSAVTRRKDHCSMNKKSGVFSFRYAPTKGLSLNWNLPLRLSKALKLYMI